MGISDSRGRESRSSLHLSPGSTDSLWQLVGGGANAGHSYVGSRVHRRSWRLSECLDNTTRVRAETKTAAGGDPSNGHIILSQICGYSNRYHHITERRMARERIHQEGVAALFIGTWTKPESFYTVK